MANDCSTTICVTGYLPALADLYSKLQTILEEDNSLAYIVEKFGISPMTVSCRGYLEDIRFEAESERLFLFAINAWAPMLEMWERIFQWKYYNGKFDYVYTAEEPGCGIYINSDESREIFTTNWILDTDCDCEYYDADEEKLLLEDINDLIKEEGFDAAKTIDEAEHVIEKINRKGERFILLAAFETPT